MPVPPSTSRVLLTVLLVLAGLAPASEAQALLVQTEHRITTSSAGFDGILDPADFFGRSVAALGDLDGDGVPDLAVAATGDDDGESGQGAVWILFLNADGTVREHQKISAIEGGFGGDLDYADSFGSSLCSLGDPNGDGRLELAVGAIGNDDSGPNQGAVWILSLEHDGTVHAETKISAAAGGFGGALDPWDSFGRGLAAIGDLDGDGVGDLAVGADGDDDGGDGQGAVWILFMNPDGTVRTEQKVSATSGGFAGDLDETDRFGIALASPGDLDGDGRVDLVVGAPWDDDGGLNRGAVWVLFLNDDGTVREHRKISQISGGFGGRLYRFGSFGSSCAAVGDLDLDGTVDLAVGAPEGPHEPSDRGGVLWILFMTPDGNVHAEQKISGKAGGFDGPVPPGTGFGSDVASPGDLDGDGVPDLAVGAWNTFGDKRGAAWTLLLGRCTRFDFETEDDLVTPLVNGQHVDTELGTHFTVTGSGTNAGVAVFDSSVGGPNDPSQDPDLLVDTGNLLILQTENLPPDADDVFPRPNDDDDGGTLTFDFASEVEAGGVRLVDVDATDPDWSVVLTDSSARRRAYTVPAGWTGDLTQGERGEHMLDLTTRAPQPVGGVTATVDEENLFDPHAVVRIEVVLGGSGAVDDIDVLLPAPALPAADIGTRNGSGLNPSVLTGLAPPVLGAAFEARLDCSAEGPGLAILEVRRLPATGTSTLAGERLVEGALVFRSVRAHAGTARTLTWAVPPDASLAGTTLHAQGLCRAAASSGGRRLARPGAGRLSNALDLTLGY